jgi:hypothetical protein
MKLMFVSLAAAAAFTGGAANAHPAGYGGGYLPPPPYAYAPGYDNDTRVEVKCSSHALELLGARAGVTVLGVDLDGSANLRLGLHHKRHCRAFYETPVSVPAPPPYAGYGYVHRYRW